MATDAAVNRLLSASATAMPGSTATGPPSSTNVAAPADVVTSGRWSTAVTVTSRSAGALRLPSALPSSTTTLIVRRAVLGSTLVLRYVTERSAASYAAGLAAPLSVKTPVLWSYEPLMAGSPPRNANTS